MRGNNYQEKAQGFTAMLKSIFAKLLASKIIDGAKSDLNKEVSEELAEEIVNNYFIKMTEKLTEQLNNGIVTKESEYLDYKFLLLKKL